MQGFGNLAFMALSACPPAVATSQSAISTALTAAPTAAADDGACVLTKCDQQLQLIQMPDHSDARSFRCQIIQMTLRVTLRVLAMLLAMLLERCMRRCVRVTMNADCACTRVPVPACVACHACPPAVPTAAACDQQLQLIQMPDHSDDPARPCKVQN